LAGGGFAGDGDVGAGGKLEVAAAGGVGDVGVVEGVGVRDGWRGGVGEEDAVQVDLGAVVVVVAVEEDLAAAGDADVAQGDVAEGGWGWALDGTVGGS